MMSMLRSFLLCAVLATAGMALAVPAAAQSGKDQIAAERQELDKNKSTGVDGGTQPVAASSENLNNNPGVSGTHTKPRKRDKNKAKPAPSEQEEEFNRVLLGIHG
jgi:hypothetical protein